MENIMNIIGNNIKSLRTGSNLSQGNLATFLGVDQSLISKIEKGERTITSDMLEKISELFGVTLDNISKEMTDFKKISFAFRASEIQVKDLETIHCINKLALNLNFMKSLVEEGKNG